MSYRSDTTDTNPAIDAGIDQASDAHDAAEEAEELAAHLRRFVRALESGTADFETRYSIGQDVLELTESLRKFAVVSFVGA